jgi:hypothetical protein
MPRDRRRHDLAAGQADLGASDVTSSEFTNALFLRHGCRPGANSHAGMVSAAGRSEAQVRMELLLAHGVRETALAVSLGCRACSFWCGIGRRPNPLSTRRTKGSPQCAGGLTRPEGTGDECRNCTWTAGFASPRGRATGVSLQILEVSVGPRPPVYASYQPTRQGPGRSRFDL